MAMPQKIVLPVGSMVNLVKRPPTAQAPNPDRAGLTWYDVMVTTPQGRVYKLTMLTMNEVALARQIQTGELLVGEE